LFLEKFGVDSKLTKDTAKLGKKGNHCFELFLELETSVVSKAKFTMLFCCPTIYKDSCISAVTGRVQTFLTILFYVMNVSWSHIGCTCNKEQKTLLHSLLTLNSFNSASRITAFRKPAGNKINFAVG